MLTHYANYHVDTALLDAMTALSCSYQHVNVQCVYVSIIRRT